MRNKARVVFCASFIILMFFGFCESANLAKEDYYKDGQLSDQIHHYEHLVMEPATVVNNPGTINPPWAQSVDERASRFRLFIAMYPDSPLVPSAWLRIAELYLTVKSGDERNDWADVYLHESDAELKDNPHLLHPDYKSRALVILARIISGNTREPHYSALLGGGFAWNDKVVAVALYIRSMLKEFMCEDLKRLRLEFPDSGSSRGAISAYGKHCLAK